MASTNLLDPIPHPPKKPVVGNMLSIDATSPGLTPFLNRMNSVAFWLGTWAVNSEITWGTASRMPR